MSKREKLEDAAVKELLGERAGWRAEGGKLVKEFAFSSYPRSLAFVVEVGFAAERRDHHPDFKVGYRKVEVVWTTHDRGGITQLDFEMAARSDELAAGAG
jgi:4a-hydroxytetrahydrobiopterin dehydratase